MSVTLCAFVSMCPRSKRKKALTINAKLVCPQQQLVILKIKLKGQILGQRHMVMKKW